MRLVEALPGTAGLSRTCEDPLCCCTRLLYGFGVVHPNVQLGCQRAGVWPVLARHIQKVLSRDARRGSSKNSWILRHLAINSGLGWPKICSPIASKELSRAKVSTGPDRSDHEP